jgi:hypothetical protein
MEEKDNKVKDQDLIINDDNIIEIKKLKSKDHNLNNILGQSKKKPTNSVDTRKKEDKEENIDDKKDKTIFSKLSENLYKDNKNYLLSRKDIYDIDKGKEDKYNILTIEIYLVTCAKKENSKNNKVISEFIQRKKKENICKKIGIEVDKRDSIPLHDHFKEASMNYKKIQLAQGKNIRSKEQFLDDQKFMEEKHKKLMKHLIEINNKEINKTLKEHPTITKHSEKLANIHKVSNKDIYVKLYEEAKNKNKSDYEKFKNNYYNTEDIKSKKLNYNKIKANTQRLYEEYEKRKAKLNENEEKKKENVKIMQKLALMGPNSNQIIHKKLIKIYKVEYASFFQKNISEKIDISFDKYLTFIFRLGLIGISFNEEQFLNSSKNKNLFESDYYKLVKDSWKMITKSKTFEKELTASSYMILLFYLHLSGIYKNGDENNLLIKNNFPFLFQENVDSFSPKVIEKIYSYFYLFRNSLFNKLQTNKKNELKFIDIRRENINISRSYEKGKKTHGSKKKSSSRINQQYLTMHYNQRNENHFDKIKRTKKLSTYRVISCKEKKKIEIIGGIEIIKDKIGNNTKKYIQIDNSKDKRKKVNSLNYSFAEKSGSRTKSSGELSLQNYKQLKKNKIRIIFKITKNDKIYEMVLGKDDDFDSKVKKFLKDNHLNENNKKKIHDLIYSNFKII